MRILLLTGDQHMLQDLARALEARGHQVALATSAGEDVLAATKPGGRLHAAVLSQGALGKRWPKLLRQLRRQAPYLPAVLLMRPGAARAWRVAIRAGAFDALPESAPQDAVLQAISRALAYAGGKSVGARCQLPNAA
jgi:DNA-binding NtrC family response regulator